MLKSIFAFLAGIFLIGLLWIDPIKAGDAFLGMLQSVIDFMVYIAQNVKLPSRGEA